jgi:hypothetical protein
MNRTHRLFRTSATGLLLLAAVSAARAAPVPAPWVAGDIGAPGAAGGTDVDEAGVWTVRGSSGTLNVEADHMQLASLALCGDGTLANGRLFANIRERGNGVPDGMKVDVEGNLYFTGQGGIWVFSAAGKHLGTIRPPEVAANVGFGDADFRSLYITAQTGLYRIRLNVAGMRR